ncbi:MAG: hypothetical protein HY688_00250, partial [Chloroflexi bacterium]|nr:hypothetical protein [Chloroflexota bacterium]
LQAEDRSREFGTFRLEKTTPGPALYVFLSPYTDQVPAVQALYPGGRRTEEWASDGRLLFVAYEVS